MISDSDSLEGARQGPTPREKARVAALRHERRVTMARWNSRPVARPRSGEEKEGLEKAWMLERILWVAEPWMRTAHHAEWPRRPMDSTWRALAKNWGSGWAGGRCVGKGRVRSRVSQ